MPSHPDRVAKNYAGLCVKCLKHPNNEWDDEDSMPLLCTGCKWRKWIADGTFKIPNENIQRILDRYAI